MAFGLDQCCTQWDKLGFEKVSTFSNWLFQRLALEKGNKMNTIEIRKMSTIERLQAMEALWDSLLYEESEIESPEWHRDILEGRKRKIENGKAEFISLEELKASRKS